MYDTSMCAKVTMVLQKYKKIKKNTGCVAGNVLAVAEFVDQLVVLAVGESATFVNFVESVADD